MIGSIGRGDRKGVAENRVLANAVTRKSPDWTGNEGAEEARTIDKVKMRNEKCKVSLRTKRIFVRSNFAFFISHFYFFNFFSLRENTLHSLHLAILGT